MKRDILGFPGYSVDDVGNVWSKNWSRNQFQWRLVTGGRGGKVGEDYRAVWLCKDGKQIRKYIHVLVLEAFVSPRPEGMQARHFPDVDRFNNRLENLSWGTPQENSADKIVHGTNNHGEGHVGHRFTESLVRAVLGLKGLLPVNDIARQFSMTPRYVRSIHSGAKWKYLQQGIAA